jgi:hypothetical protein
LEKKELGLLEHRDLPSFYLIWKDEAEFKDELLKFQTNLLRKLCHLEEVKNHAIQKASDGSMWLNSLAPVVYVMDEIKLRDDYAKYFKKESHFHSDLIA